jgi:hypothetical protein
MIDDGCKGTFLQGDSVDKIGPQRSGLSEISATLHALSWYMPLHDRRT